MDMKNLICIDLRQFNNEKLKDVSKSLNLIYENLLIGKKDGFVKIYIDRSTGLVVATTHKDDLNNIVLSSEFTKSLSEMPTFSMPKKEIKNLSIDSILDKISKYGMESLNENEIGFLEKNS
jgi:hypothetical protein